MVDESRVGRFEVPGHLDGNLEAIAPHSSVMSQSDTTAGTSRPSSIERIKSVVAAAGEWLAAAGRASGNDDDLQLMRAGLAARAESKELLRGRLT